MAERDRRLLRRLSALDGPSIPGWVAGALLDDHRRSPSDLAEDLVDAQMLDVATLGPGAPHYRFHDVIRVFAREKLSDDAPEERTGAVARLCGAWLAMAEEAHRRVYGGDYLLVHGDAPRWHPPQKVMETELHSPMDWLDSERANLCSVVGLAADAGLDEVCWDLASSLVTLFERRSYLSLWKVVAAWREHGTSVPLFRKTSCGVTYAHDVPDYNGHWGVPELCDICPAKQRQLCADNHHAPTEAEFRNVLAGLEYGTDIPFLVEDGHILTHALGEQRRYAIQHTLGYQVWEVDHPHVHRAHGRTLKGYELSEDERRQLDEARERLHAAARHEDD